MFAPKTIAVFALLAATTGYAMAQNADAALGGVTTGLSASAPQKFTFFGFHVYDATLHADKAKFNVAKLTESRFALGLKYARNLDGDKIAERSDSEIDKLGIATAEERSAWLAAMRKMFPNVKAGDVIHGVFTPGKGTQFFHNAKAIGSVEGTKFAEAFFGIWLHEKTTAPALREALLGSLNKGVDAK